MFAFVPGAFVKIKEYDTSLRRDHLLMHHKFVVIDKKLLITGSLNWTGTVIYFFLLSIAICFTISLTFWCFQALSGNWEDAAIISESSIVQKFDSEFQYLWDNFNTIE